MSDKCPVCDGLVRGGVLCKQHRHELADALADIQGYAHDLDAAVRKEAKISANGPHGNNAYPPSPISESAWDLRDGVSGALFDIAATIGWWPGVLSVHDMASGLRHRIDRLAMASDCKHAYQLATSTAVKLRDRLTPRSERIIIGSCPNPMCGHALSITRGQGMVTCDYCGSVWAVGVVTEHRVEHAKPKKPIIATPSEAAHWLRMVTKLDVKRGDVSNWIARGRLPNSPSVGNGMYEFHRDELYACVSHLIQRDTPVGS